MTSTRGGGLHHTVLTQIGSDLMDGRLSAGDVFSMEQFEARYGVSRTVVREVIKVLESIGVASSRRRSVPAEATLTCSSWPVASSFRFRLSPWRLNQAM